jgi:hypothetical protein
MIQHVLQKHSNGCGPASLAMIDGKTYEEILAYFPPDHDFDVNGCYHHALYDYLVDHGYALALLRKFKGWFKKSGEDRQVLREPWPPEPFAEVHLCQVVVSETSPRPHFCIMLGDGSVLDPLTVDKKSLKDYFDIYSVAGVYKVGSPCPATTAASQ